MLQQRWWKVGKNDGQPVEMDVSTDSLHWLIAKSTTRRGRFLQLNFSQNMAVSKPIWKVSNTKDICEICGGETIENVEHTLFHCRQYEQEGRYHRSAFGIDPTHEHLVDEMVETKDKWNAMSEIVAKIIKTQRAQEQQRRREGGRSESSSI